MCKILFDEEIYIITSTNKGYLNVIHLDQDSGTLTPISKRLVTAEGEIKAISTT